MFVLLLLLSLLQYGDTFDPGCSFMNGQCQYSVKLGHEGQCDTQTTAATTASASCCAAVQNDVTLMKASMASMAKQIEQIQSTTRANATSPNELLIADELQKALLEKESQIGNITKQAAAEIARLQNEVDTCRKRPDCGGRPRSTTTSTPTATTSKPINTYYHATFCDFESTGQLWVQPVQPSLVEMVPWEGKKSTLTGPLSDHTLGTPGGAYLYIDTYKSAQWYGPKTISAIMESPVFAPSPNYCVRFWYNMFGKNIEDLNVYAKVGSGNGYPIWTRSKGNAIEWKMGEVDIGSEYTSRPFHVVFEATSRSYKTKPHSTYRYDPDYHDTYGNIALDDVLVYNTTCNSLPQCPPGSFMRTVNDSRSCYSFHTSAASWITGQVNCKVENALSHLVAINSKEEQDFLVNVIKSNAALTAAGIVGFYTSGNDELNEKTFQWTGSEVSSNITYTNWYPGQPNNVAGVQHCLLMEYPNADYQWGDIECNTAHPYICEVDLPKAVHQPGTSQ
ncbi:MAM and LDL-receptor class A domain-containing protein 1-like isoform X1 [Haliotis rubra]|uniref:MAM and LDL-receptor class A domain-containing protein 1-like isoform X1 n=1 Tax=Haliotis rubra TaxID=36100 RepID=UPI001EE61738|nr:MAM and LDL-receptor class A domain-containing protein 1-like isoform X1 [Haliotis rubra]